MSSEQICENDKNLIMDLFKQISKYKKVAQKYKEKHKNLLSKNECSICMENQRQIIFHPCNHFVSCEKCSIKFNSCPFCKQVIISKNKIFNI